MRIRILPLLLFCSLLCGCATPYSIYTDERSVSTQAHDKSIATDIKTRLMGQKLSEGWDVAVYCFRGKVWLLGDIPQNQQQWAMTLAKKTQGVKEVTTHWYTEPGWGVNDKMTDMALDANLLGASMLNSTQISTQVHAGEAILLGIVSDQGMVNRAIQIAKNTNGVLKVTSYLQY